MVSGSMGLEIISLLINAEQLLSLPNYFSWKEILVSIQAGKANAKAITVVLGNSYALVESYAKIMKPMPPRQSQDSPLQDSLS